MSLSGSLWADTVLGEEHSDTEGRLEEETVDMESTPLKQRDDVTTVRGVR